MLTLPSPINDSHIIHQQPCLYKKHSDRFELVVQLEQISNSMADYDLQK